MSSPSSESTSSTATSGSRKRVTFMETDTIVSLPPYVPSEAVSETERPQILPPPAPPLYSPNSTTSTLSTGPHTPPPTSEADILIRDQDGVATSSGNLISAPSDAVVPQEAKEVDTYEPFGLVLHPCLTTSNPIHWNMLIDPQTSLRPPELDEIGHEFMTDPAFPDSISKIRISCDILPWPIIINIEPDDPEHSPQIIEDITKSIYDSLWKLANSVDLDNQTTERQRGIKKAYRRRCRRLSLDEQTNGLRRIDFLEDQTMFLGLTSGNHEDEWNLHIGPEN